jgi:hypothetical protein
MNKSFKELKKISMISVVAGLKGFFKSIEFQEISTFLAMDTVK